MNFSAVILAGGKSSRMGRDKAFLEFEGATLLARQVKLVRDAGAKEVFISGHANTDYSTFGCPVLLDDFLEAGPLAGMERALNACSSSMLLVLAVDLPQMTTGLLQTLAQSCGGNTGVIPRLDQKIQPLAAYYPKTALPLILEALSSQSFAVTQFAEKCVQNSLGKFIDIPASKAACFSNWNSPTDARTGLAGINAEQAME